MRKKIISIGVIAALIIVGIVIYRLSVSSKSIIELKTGKIGRATINNTVEATGTLEATVTVEVGTQVSGLISNIYVDNNSIVKKGDLLAMLDTQALRSSWEQSKASYDQAVAEYEYQKANYERYQKLIEKKLIAQSDFDQVSYNYKAALAGVSSAKASLDKDKTNLGYAYIYSTIDGIVLERAVEEGETVAASYSTPTLFTIANDLTKMEIEVDVDEADIGQIKVNQRVTFTVDAFYGKVFEGTVTEVGLMATTDESVVTYAVVVDAPNPDQTLVPGLTATVTFYVTEKENIVVVPNQAFEFSPDMEMLQAYQEAHPEIKVTMPDPAEKTGESEKTVWVKTADAIYPKTIVVGETDEINYELVEGLTEGDEVVLAIESITKKSAKAAEQQQGSSNPFMPTPPGRNRR